MEPSVTPNRAQSRFEALQGVAQMAQVLTQAEETYRGDSIVVDGQLKDAAPGGSRVSCKK